MGSYETRNGERFYVRKGESSDDAYKRHQEGGSRSGDSMRTQQQATNARLIENMNEAQINNEIAQTKRDIAKAESAIGRNNITNTAEARAMREAFPLGYGGKTEKQIAQIGKLNERDAHKAKAYTEAWSDKKSAETRLEKLEQAKKAVKGTGKTQKQINAEKQKNAVETAPKSLTWKTTNKGSYTATGGYQPKIIKAGNFEIHGTSGYYTIYRDGKEVGSANKLSTAKAFAERLNKK